MWPAHENIRDQINDWIEEEQSEAKRQCLYTAIADGILFGALIRTEAHIVKCECLDCRAFMLAGLLKDSIEKKE